MFDLFFAGTQSSEANNLILDSGYNRLFSYANDRKCIEDWVVKAKERNWTGKFFLDSGAFSANTRGIEIKLEDYVDFVNGITDSLYCFANLDVINTELHTDIMVTAKQSFDNFLKIIELAKEPEKCVGVYHRGEPIEVLHWYIDYFKKHPEMRYIAVSAGNLLSGDPFSHCRDACKLLKKEVPWIKIHLFAYTRLGKLKHINCDSADSTTWIMVAANGGIVTDYGVLPISKNQKHNPASVYGLPEQAYKNLEKYIQDKGFTIEQLAEDYKQRGLFNIKYIADKAAQIEYIPIMKKRSLL